MLQNIYNKTLHTYITIKVNFPKNMESGFFKEARLVRFYFCLFPGYSILIKLNNNLRTLGIGFTGGHNHWNWGEPNFRKLVLNGTT